MKDHQMAWVSIYYLLKTLLIQTKNQKQNMHEKISKKHPDMNMFAVDAYVLVQENHININQEW